MIFGDIHQYELIFGD